MVWKHESFQRWQRHSPTRGQHRFERSRRQWERIDRCSNRRDLAHQPHQLRRRCAHCFLETVVFALLLFLIHGHVACQHSYAEKKIKRTIAVSMVTHRQQQKKLFNEADVSSETRHSLYRRCPFSGRLTLTVTEKFKRKVRSAAFAMKLRYQEQIARSWRYISSRGEGSRRRIQSGLLARGPFHYGLHVSVCSRHRRCLFPWNRCMEKEGPKPS